MSVTRNSAGAYVIADIINGYRVQRTYFGYTKHESIALFKRSTKT